MANTSENLPSVELFYRSGTSDKIYNVQIVSQGNGYMVNAQNGRRGGSLSYMVKTASPVSLYQAQSVYNELVDSKKAKGYTENPNGVPYSQPDPFTRRRQVSAISTPVPPPMAVKAPAVKEDGERAFTAMLLTPITEDEAPDYINDDNYMAEEKKNGRRISLLNDGKEIQGFNKTGKSRPLPLTIANEVPKGLKVQLDSEMIGDVLWVFDLLSMGGMDFRDSTTLERYEMLQTLDLETPHIHTVEAAFTKAQKQKLFDRLKRENAEGIVFKLKDSRYVGGKSDVGPHFKCKFYHEASVLVTKVNTKRSVAVAVFDDNGKHINLGNVTIPPNKEIPAKGAVIEVRYLTCLKGGSLYQPNYKEDRSDEIDESSCIESQIVYTEEIE